MADKHIIDVYECLYYWLDMLSQCKYYPKGCNECGYLIKLRKENEQ